MSLLTSSQALTICASGVEDHGGKNADWWGESRMEKAPDSTAKLYHATMTNKYVGHRYFFDVTLNSERYAVVKINTPHGKKDRTFKINFNQADGQQLASVISSEDTGGVDGCSKSYVLELARLDHITVQEKNLGGSSFWGHPPGSG